MTDPQQAPLSSEELALEVQLGSMEPVDLSTAAQTSIANRLDRRLASYRQVRSAGAIAAGVLIAIAPLILLRGRYEPPAQHSTQAANTSISPRNSTNDEKQFAIATYSNALAQSPASLNAILEQQSRQAEKNEVNDSRIPRIGDGSILTP